MCNTHTHTKEIIKIANASAPVENNTHFIFSVAGFGLLATIVLVYVAAKAYTQWKNRVIRIANQ